MSTRTKHFLIFTLLLYSCNRLESGEVLNKEYEPATTFVMFMPMVIDDKGNTIMIPYIIYDNEDYKLTVRGQYEGKTRFETVYVTEACYKSTLVGDTWHKSADCHFSDFNNTKTAQ